MKIKIVTTIILSILALGVFGQVNQKRQFEIGITYNHIFTKNQKYDRNPATNFSTGIFGKYQIIKRLGIGIGVEYQTQHINTIELINCDPSGFPFFCESPSQDKFEIAKIPIWVNLNLNYKSNPKIKTDLIGGYGFGKLLNSKEKETEYRLHGLIDNLHFGLIGIEFQKEIIKNIKLTLGSHLEITNIYDDEYGEIQNIKIVLRISK
jgi:hypothetical protein